jgi:hypothetical protein
MQVWVPTAFGDWASRYPVMVKAEIIIRKKKAIPHLIPDWPFIRTSFRICPDGVSSRSPRGIDGFMVPHKDLRLGVFSWSFSASNYSKGFSDNILYLSWRQQMGWILYFSRKKAVFCVSLWRREGYCSIIFVQDRVARTECRPSEKRYIASSQALLPHSATHCFIIPRFPISCIPPSLSELFEN